jgi:hypothetical protein
MWINYLTKKTKREYERRGKEEYGQKTTPRRTRRKRRVTTEVTEDSWKKRSNHGEHGVHGEKEG